MKTESEYKHDSRATNEGVNNTQLLVEINNSYRNYYKIINGMGKQFKDLSVLNKSGRDAIIFGSGYNLTKFLKRLNEVDISRFDIYCSESQLSTLILSGITPTYIVGLDARQKPFEKSMNGEALETARNIPLLCPPTFNADIVLQHKGPVYLFRQKVNSNSFHSRELLAGYSNVTVEEIPGGMTNDQNKKQYKVEPLIRTEISIHACSAPLLYYCAARLSGGKVYAVGCDFGFVDGYDRLEKKENKDGINEFIYPKKVDGYVSLKGDNGILTEPIQVFYKRNMLAAIRMAEHPIAFAGEGLITEVPIVDLPGDDFSFNENWKDTIDIALAKGNIFTVELSNGNKIFVEPEQWGNGITDFLENLRSKRECTKCKAAYMQKKGAKKIDKCMRCGSSVDIAFHFDIESNMKRMKNLEKFVPKC